MTRDVLKILWLLFSTLICVAALVPPVGAAEQPQETAGARTDAGGAQPAPEPPTLEIPSDKQQLIGVKTVAVSLRPMRSRIRTVGRIEYDERGLATINTRFEGWIEKLDVNVTGSIVKRNQILAEIYSPELYATQLEFINALHMAKAGATESGRDADLATMLAGDSRAIVEAAKQRLRLWNISDSQIAAIARSGKPIRTMSIQSPVDGVVIQKNAILGMRTMPGEKLFDIADLKTVWVVADLYESQIERVGIGESVTVTLDNFPGRTISSTIDFVSPVLTGETRTMRVRCTIPNPDGSLKPQMFATMEIMANLGDRLAVPDDAVLDTGTRKIVYVDKGEGIFEPREVRTGLKSDGLTEIVQGLGMGEKVASAANFLIDSEAQLKGVRPLDSR